MTAFRPKPRLPSFHRRFLRARRGFVSLVFGLFGMPLVALAIAPTEFVAFERSRVFLDASAQIASLSAVSHYQYNAPNPADPGFSTGAAQVASEAEALIADSLAANATLAPANLSRLDIDAFPVSRQRFTYGPPHPKSCASARYEQGTGFYVMVGAALGSANPDQQVGATIRANIPSSRNTVLPPAATLAYGTPCP